MKSLGRILLTVATVILFAASVAMAGGRDQEAVSLFKRAGSSASYFSNSYGYVIFPAIGKAGFGVGAARGHGQVYERGKLVGRSTMTQLSVGFQVGAEEYSQIIFFADRNALNDFKKGNFEFGADVNAIAITAAASVSAGTNGTDAAASGGQSNATTAGGYQHGVAVFTIAKGGLMYQATLGGQKFSYTPLGR